jgi:hypothetical protein
MRGMINASIAVFLFGSLVGFGTTRLTERRFPPPAVGVARYLEGMRTWDGHAVWSSYSADYQNLLAEEGGGEAATVRLYDELRTRGASIDEVSYVGGYQTRMTGYFLYVTRHFLKGEDPIEVVWIFRTDADGLIESID